MTPRERQSPWGSPICERMELLGFLCVYIIAQGHSKMQGPGRKFFRGAHPQARPKAPLLYTHFPKNTTTLLFSGHEKKSGTRSLFFSGTAWWRQDGPGGRRGVLAGPGRPYVVLGHAPAAAGSFSVTASSSAPAQSRSSREERKARRLCFWLSLRFRGSMTMLTSRR